MRWYDMKGQPNRDSNPVLPSQGSNHSTNWANEAGEFGRVESANMYNASLAIDQDIVSLDVDWLLQFSEGALKI